MTGMTFSIILFAVQIAVTLFALLREAGKDTRFSGDRLDYRS